METKARAGGRVNKSDILVNVDNVTMFGNGTIEHPLTASPGSVTIEHIANSGDDADVAASPTVNISFVTDGSSSEVGNVTLADGQVDGFQKTIIIRQSTAQWTITPENMIGGGEILIQGSGLFRGGSAVLAWDATAGAWEVVSLTTAVL